MVTEIHIPEWASHMVSDHTDMDRNPHPVDARKVSKLKLELADDVYFEYGFLMNTDEVKADPKNPVKARNPWYPNASSVIGPAYQPDAYARLDTSVATGTLTRHRVHSAVLGQTRRVSVYTPEGYESDALPCIYVQDGTAYLRVAQLHTVLEQLVKDHRVRPAHLVFIEPIERSIEYPFNQTYRDFIKDELFAFIAEHHHVSNERIMMGASLGGLFSATFALLNPEFVTGIITQSGAFLGAPDHKVFYDTEQSWVLETVTNQPDLTFSWYQETGTIEWLCGINRQLKDVLKNSQTRTHYAERHAGHNWENWRNGLATALEFSLAGA